LTRTVTDILAITGPIYIASAIWQRCPSMSIYPILAKSYGKEDLGAAALLVCTVTSLFTLSDLIWLTQNG